MAKNAFQKSAQLDRLRSPRTEDGFESGFCRFLHACDERCRSGTVTRGGVETKKAEAACAAPRLVSQGAMK
jgi:hypothetical protein